MNSAGDMVPRSGEIQRRRASAPTMRPVPQLDDRLVVEVELPGFEGGADLLLGGGGGQRAGHGPVEDRDVAGALGLGLVHGHVGVAQHLLGLARPGARRGPRPRWRRCASYVADGEGLLDDLG